MYLVDANVLIEAKNRYYAFDIAPGFWSWLEHAHLLSHIRSITAVNDEIQTRQDELSDWANKNAHFFESIDGPTVSQFRTLTDWAKSQHYTPSALANFTNNSADFQLIAHAKAHNLTLVTHEKSQPKARKRILIPDACAAMNVDTIDTFEMLRALTVQFDLSAANTSHTTVGP